MSFASCLFFCQLIFTPLVFGVLYMGWKDMIPQLSTVATSAIAQFENVLPVDSYGSGGSQFFSLLAISFCYALVISLPLSFLFSVKE